MKHKSLFTALAVVMLTSGFGTVATTTSQPVQAISKYTWHWHWVHTTKSVHIYKVKVGRYMYQSKLVDLGIIDKGYFFKVRYSGHDYPWQVKDAGPGLHGHLVILHQKADWFKNGK